MFAAAPQKTLAVRTIGTANIKANPSQMNKITLDIIVNGRIFLLSGLSAENYKKNSSAISHRGVGLLAPMGRRLRLE